MTTEEYIAALKAINDAGYAYESRWLYHGTPRQFCRLTLTLRSDESVKHIFEAKGADVAAQLALDELAIDVQLSLL